MFDAKAWAAAQVEKAWEIRQLPAETMFTPAFMCKNTDYKDIDSFVKDVKRLIEEEDMDINTFTKEFTFFENWTDMYRTAYEEAFLKQG